MEVYRSAVRSLQDQVHALERRQTRTVESASIRAEASLQVMPRSHSEGASKQ
jgi:hypothetical protein